MLRVTGQKLPRYGPLQTQRGAENPSGASHKTFRSRGSKMSFWEV